MYIYIDRECDVYRVYTFKNSHFKDEYWFDCYEEKEVFKEGVKESMQEIEVYINPEDIINKLSKKDKEIYDKCIFKSVRLGEEGSITISCILINQQGIGGKYRYHLGQDEINLMG